METRARITDTTALLKAMAEKGFRTNTSLAIKAGINRTTLGQVLNGQIQPSSDVMYKLVTTLELSEIEAGRIFFAHNLPDT